jgi:hypothetical protein
MKKTMQPKVTKPYWEMNAEELREATKMYDKPLPESEFRTMTRAERARHDRMMKGPSGSIFIHRRDEPKKSKVQIQLTEDLLKHCNEYASKHDLTISDVIAMSLKSSFVFAE